MNMPHFASLDELVELFDTHDLGEYWDEMPEAHFEVDIKTKTHIGNQGCNTQFSLECNGEVKGWRYCHDGEILHP